ncbi:hypothetical protein [Gluconobacter sphaericus]|uniref:Pycsar effector protein domain-containing protein n=1 Tax=Gluconobacter sphaericus NBRC 12467 TaxID=1307951 RepID=A0AA37WA75_9PROT|nr:hypothetical protein [Gluconobacter sphaericus]MBF0885544.1 hypothetical protein [Gluconobacter sphaericus]GBR56510.1 hypothetical protein AA12467_2648 [Gluconobacter sphaericus NBRC 12467]GEB42782.1 hypothetical protein GSP01_15640 [Gluconobacter sphaericus NBRC 12467]GLQ84758.1 hypothetical protein GCM10007872_16660 [Gluconobacter sphaericus NBRC 12467]GLQ85087.1 hypothetical protein GCM10007872_19950 [Gluconobacter sphaericus NBRC 12467]
MMSDDQELQPWLAKEMLRQAEATCKTRVDAINKTRDRASSLLGWSIAALTGSVALAAKGFGGQSMVLLPSLVLCAGFAATCLCCVWVLMPLRIERMTLYPIEVEQIAGQTRATTEEQLQVAIADHLALAECENAKAHEKRQKWLKAAWFGAIIGPCASLLLVALS